MDEAGAQELTMDIHDEIAHANRVRTIVTYLQWGCVLASLGIFIALILIGVAAGVDASQAKLHARPWESSAPSSTSGNLISGGGMGALVGLIQAIGWAVLWVGLSILRLIAVQTQHTLGLDLYRQQETLRARQPSEYGPRAVSPTSITPPHGLPIAKRPPA